MHRQTITTGFLNTIGWLDDTIVDWTVAGKQYFLDGKVREIGKYHFAFNFDSSVIADDGQYAVVYQKLGTKGLLLKNGEILREINRSYYCADVYEYPVTFVTAKNGNTYLIHCPNKYCQIDFEEVETGEIVTAIPGRKPSDFFHSRFEISPDNAFLISKGWAWHPFDFVEVFDIEACLKNPLLLDKSNLNPDVANEICSASFINNHLILIGSAKDDYSYGDKSTEKLNPGQVAFWDIRTNLISKPLQVDVEFGGHLTAIDETYAWDLFNYPKIINFKTGQVEDELRDIFSGEQKSSIY